MRRALAFPDLRGRYPDILESCARAASEDDWLVNETTRVAALIGDAAHEDIWRSYSNEAYDAAVDFLKDFARRRPAVVREQVTGARAR